MTRRLAAALAVALLVLPTTGCAWSNRDNRPVWNAFEAHLVPEDDTAFMLALPLTVPGGLVSILLDTFVVHPAQILDDAAGDAAELWENLGPKFAQHYYTQMAVLPFRAVGTPVTFVFSFLGRSLFDIPPHGHTKVDAAEDPAVQQQRTAELLNWLRDLAARRESWRHMAPPVVWTPELRSALDEALASADTEGRLDVLVYLVRHAVPVEVHDPLTGLADPDAVFRYLLLQRWPQDAHQHLPESVRAALRTDPSPAVRELAARLQL